MLNDLSQHAAASITYSGSKMDMHVYTDSDWSSGRNTRRSTSGYVVCMAGGPVDRSPISRESSYQRRSVIVMLRPYVREYMRDK